MYVKEKVEKSRSNASSASRRPELFAAPAQRRPIARAITANCRRVCTTSAEPVHNLGSFYTYRTPYRTRTEPLRNPCGTSPYAEGFCTCRTLLQNPVAEPLCRTPVQNPCRTLLQNPCAEPLCRTRCRTPFHSTADSTAAHLNSPAAVE